ncbi:MULTISPECIES: hypothetical protein [Amycolatopsis]|uniref:hypothetical protein n=1 Tax=Amycolatopsis TaxID=1813 RepID=UPI001F26B4CB|nr:MULTISPECIES: hypothetical protein [Amycolatopsis]UKD58250.1 hypothetical protein L3Q65_16420 [Amycolatopsis sp. FU40]
MTIHLSTAGEGPELDTKDATVTVKASAADTGGYELFEVDAPRGPAVPPHADPWAKSFYVLHGRITVCLDGELHDLAPARSRTSRRALSTPSRCTRRRPSSSC